MQDPVQEKQKQISRARSYLICAGVVLFIFALLWSVDSAIAYILFALFSFFLVLGLISWPWEKKVSKTWNQGKHQASSASSAAGPKQSFDELFENVLKKAKREDSKAHHTPSSGKANAPRRSVEVGRIVAVFIFCVFLVIFIMVFFDAPEYESIERNYLQQATDYYNNNLYDSALVNYKRFLVENPNHGEALFGLGNAYFQLNKPDSALLMYDRCVAVDPTMIDATYTKGWVEYNRKKYAESAQILKELVRKNPDYGDALLLLGDVYYSQDQYDEALRWYDAAYAKGQHGSWICYVMGYLYQEKGNTKRAVELYKESLTYDTTVIDVYKRLGDLLPDEDGAYYRSVANGTQW